LFCISDEEERERGGGGEGFYISYDKIV